MLRGASRMDACAPTHAQGQSVSQAWFLPGLLLSASPRKCLKQVQGHRRGTHGDTQDALNQKVGP